MRGLCILARAYLSALLKAHDRRGMRDPIEVAIGSLR